MCTVIAYNIHDAVGEAPWNEVGILLPEHSKYCSWKKLIQLGQTIELLIHNSAIGECEHLAVFLGAKCSPNDPLEVGIAEKCLMVMIQGNWMAQCNTRAWWHKWWHQDITGREEQLCSRVSDSSSKDIPVLGMNTLSIEARPQHGNIVTTGCLLNIQ